MRGDQLHRHFRYALKDIRMHRFLHTVTLVTITLSVIIVGVFTLFATNAASLITSWKSGVRIMAYLPENTTLAKTTELTNTVKKIPFVGEVRFIPKNEALKTLREQMARHASIFEDLDENPLPDTFEIRVKTEKGDWQTVERVARKIEHLPGVDHVEYGRQWIGKFLRVINLIRIAALSMGGIFFLVSVFIVGNTIRLAIYTRKEEIAIMRLVGAEEKFIKAPFYIQGLLLGLCGGICGITVLFIIYMIFTARMDATFAAVALRIQFISPETMAFIAFCSTLVGWTGCYLSFQQTLHDSFGESSSSGS